MDTVYSGSYRRFDTASKKDAAVLLGADCLVGDVFDVVFETNDGETLAWLKNRFDQLVGFLDTDTTRELRIFNARDWKLKALLSFVAFTDSPEPGHYWGEVGIMCFAPEHEEAFSIFIDNTAQRMAEGIRPDINLGEQGAAKVIESNGTWAPTKTVPFPKKNAGTAIVKSRRKMSEKLIEQGRKGNKGCYLISWLFLLAIVAGILFGLKSCGLF